MASLPTKRGDYNFGRNLILRVSETGASSWLFRKRMPGTVVQLGLGSSIEVNTETARRKVIELQKMVIDGQDVRQERRRRKSGDTFRQLLAQVLDARSASWKGTSQRTQWEQSLRDHAAKLMDMRVAQITHADVLQVLRPIWGSETAARVQDRIEAVLDLAKSPALKLVTENVAAWEGNLELILAAKPAKKKKGEQNHKAVPHAEVASVVARLQGAAGAGAQALAFTILTVARAGEVLGALKSEIDRETKMWVIPAGRMKAGVEHHVPLSEQAMEIVNARWEQPGDHLFAGKEGKALGATALRDKLVKGSDRGGLGIDATVHGFRSCFVAFTDETTIERHVREECLAHQLDAVEGAYKRGPAVAKRRAALQMWGNYCAGITGEVVTLQLRAA